jgi:hypothetical protein
VVQKFLDHGYRIFAVKYGELRGDEWLNEARNRGMKPGLWDDKPTAAKAETAAAYLRAGEIYCPQMETAEERDGCCEAAYWMRRNRPDIYVAVISNLYNERQDGTIAEDLASQGVAVLLEVYPAENTAWYDDPITYTNNMIWDAKRHGWIITVPLFGTYHDYPLSRFQPMNYPGSWNYLGETMTDRVGDWDIVFP